MASGKVLNFNVGILGHVDSGKTSLSKSLSTIASTACFDKNPQSKERGITLDLGFSSFTVECPDRKKDELSGFDTIQYTLVDCPGHASLIKTIIGGAQIIDLMILVVDITKGMQTQTAECLIIGEMTCNRMIVVLNKIDMLPKEKQAAHVEKMKKRMWKTLESTKFAGCPIVGVAAKPGGPEAPETESLGIDTLITTLQDATILPSRTDSGPFIFSLDHCFSIRGQGTVMTGTVLSGKISVNDTLEIPALATTKKIKSMQMFRKPINSIKQGDRAGICVTQFDPSQLERGLVCSPGALVTMEAVLVSVTKVNYYKNPISTKSKFHITLGHETVMGRVFFFHEDGQRKDEEGVRGASNQNGTVLDLGALKEAHSEFDFSKEYQYSDELLPSLSGKENEHGETPPGKQFALIELEKLVTCSSQSLLIGSRLDADVHTSSCRIAFNGVILHPISDVKYKTSVLPSVKVFKRKTREGMVERASDRYSVIGKNLFKKETNLEAFSNLRVNLSSGEAGVIEGGFGQSGKVKIRIPEGLCDETFQRYSGAGKKKGKSKGETSQEEPATESKEPVKIFLHFKRYVYDLEKKMIQTK